MRLGLCTALLAGALIVFAGRSGAAAATDTRSRVAVVRTASSDPLIREANTRLRAELAQAGFEVVEVDRAPGDRRAAVENASEATQSFATVALDRAGPGASADVWISDLTGKTVVRRLSVGAGSNAAAVLAIRALELLRASLLELASPPAPSTETGTELEPARPPPPEDVMHWVEPAIPGKSRRSVHPFAGPAISIGVLALHGVGGIGPALGPIARVSHGFGPRAFGRLSLAAPLLAPSVGAEGGQASVHQYATSLDLGWTANTGPFVAYAWAGLGAFYLHTTGSAEAPFRSTSSGVLSAMATVGLGGVAHVSDHLALSLDVAAVGLLPQPVVVIAGRDVGGVGKPSLGASLALVIEL